MPPESSDGLRSAALDDRELIAAIATGCESAFRTLFRRWAPRLRSFLIRATGSLEVGEDLLQEAFLRILRAAPRYRPHGKAAAWMYRICANLAYSYWRREHRSLVRVSDPHAIELRGIAPHRDNPDSRHLHRSFRRDVQDALMQLPPNQRMVFVLKVDRGLTYAEIAEVLHCPEGTAKSRFHHAVRRLRAELREWASGFGAGPLTNTSDEQSPLDNETHPEGTPLFTRRSRS